MVASNLELHLERSTSGGKSLVISGGGGARFGGNITLATSPAPIPEVPGTAAPKPIDGFRQETIWPIRKLLARIGEYQSFTVGLDLPRS